MRSHADISRAGISRADVHARRVVLERVCRGIALGAIVVASWLLWKGARTDGLNDADAFRVQSTLSSDAALDSAVLRHVMRGGLPDSARSDTLTLGLSRVPGDSSRALLGGLPKAGVPIVWRLLADSSADGVLAGAVSRASGPDSELLVRSTATRGAVVLRDAGGVLDSVSAGSQADASSWQLRSVTWPLTVSGRVSTIALEAPQVSRARMARVLGAPGWEYKFTVAALEELGWKVDGAVRVSPSAQVMLGAPNTSLDTARYAIVVITDSVSVDAAGIQRFVDAGGGLILLGDALRVPALSSVRPAVATERRGGIAGALLTEAPLAGLDAWELRPAADAVVLHEASGDAGVGHGHAEATVVARRHGAGRVVAIAYRDMWRWRMEGRDDGIDSHRAWWRTMLSAAGAVAGPSPVHDPHPGAGAPYADLVSWVGPEQIPSGQEAVRPARSTGDSRHLMPWLGALALALLCVEWGSRRLRGAR